MSLYLKYRPQKISQLDLEDVRNRFLRMFSSSYFPHALLFAGPKGTGKTSTARIVAKKLNCEKNPFDKNTRDKSTDAEPCLECDSCIAIKDGRHFDVLEIDAASNRGIDEIRELREKIKLAPGLGKYKVYIIDEVHMLTNEAFNALLKTLEEPPSHVVFILATTEPDKLPPTILSRCIRISFQKATSGEIIHSLDRVVKGEKVSVRDDVLTIIAEFADGSFRDATKLLEQAISEDVLTKDKILALLGRDGISSEKFLSFLVDKNTKDALTAVFEMGKQGTDIKFFVTRVLNLLHETLLSKYGISSRQESKLDKSLKEAEIVKLIKLFSGVFVELKSSSRPELPLEVAVVQWCQNKE